MMTEQHVTLRPVSLADWQELQALAIEVFTETFAPVNTPENLSAYLERAFTTEKIQEELLDSASAFYFAIVDQKAVGYLKVNFSAAQTELQDRDSLEIERIYVLNAFQKMRIGHLLFEKAVEIAQNAKLQRIWLGVWEKNLKALQFYEKKGFQVFSSHLFMMGDEPQNDLLLELRLLQN